MHASRTASTWKWAFVEHSKLQYTTSQSKNPISILSENLLALENEINDWIMEIMELQVWTYGKWEELIDGLKKRRRN